MTVKIDGTNTVANPAFTGADTDTGLQCGTNEVKLVTGGTARATVDSSGRLGIGTAAPLTRSHLEGTSGDDSTFFLTASNLAANAGGIVSFGGNYDGTNRTSWAQIKGLKDNATSGQYGGYLSFSTRPNGGSNTERMRILSDGTIRLASGCPGIDFSQIQTNASGMTSETLDSYEEGTFTPTINLTTTPISGITYTAQNGYYVKVGRLVYVSMWITWSSRTNASSSTASISLPVTSNNASGYRGAIHVSTENCTYADYGFDSSSTRNIGAMAGTHLNTNVNYMEISFTGKNGGGWGSAGLRINGLGANGGNMQLSGTYMSN